jgi:hypothetical protein
MSMDETANSTGALALLRAEKHRPPLQIIAVKRLVDFVPVRQLVVQLQLLTCPTALARGCDRFAR